MNIIKSKKEIVTEDLFDRKNIMIKKSDIFIALPGGFGTLDEVFELISLNQLSLIDKKIIILDINNFWYSLKNLIKDLKKVVFYILIKIVILFLKIPLVRLLDL